MAQTLIIPAATAAQSTQQIVRTEGYPGVVLSADALATTETCPIYIMVGNTWVRLADQGGVAQALTATVPSLCLAGGPTYGITKDATAASCGVYADYLSKTY